MDAGTTLYVESPGASYDSHLWMIISDPQPDASGVLIVNFTSWEEWKDQACIVHCGEHPYIKHKTCVNFPGAKVVKLDELHRLKDAGKVKVSDPLSAALLKKIRGAVADSRMKLEYAEILVKQGVIDDF